MFSRKKNKRNLAPQIQQIYNHVANYMVNENVKRDQAIQWLIDQGIHPEDAETITHYATEDLIKAQKKKGKRSLIIGLIIFIIGTTITLISLKHGGYITYGAIIWGLIMVIGGIITKVFAEKRFIGTLPHD